MNYESRSPRLLASLAAIGLFGLASCVCDHGEDDEVGDDTGGPEIAEPWLLAIDEDEGTIDALIQISVEPGHEGEVEVLCADLELPADFAPDTNFTSLAYRGGVLYASAGHEIWGDTLMRIDPCACTASVVGSYGFTLVSGLAANGEGVLFGIASEQDAMLEIDPATADSTVLATLADDWGSQGLTWTGPEDDRLYAVEATDDRLHRFHGVDGAAIDSVATSVDFAAVGLEYHPGRKLLYACGMQDHGDALATLDPATGLVEIVAESVFTTTCDNLAGPSGPIECAS